ncbi:RXT2-like protein [Scheffersomyces coipomensis]|uniref:RXT2-like protein n=1 Tax=Scheffersomyces coipomensis TaxID=1788519 RepID=UPI00315D1F6A
MLDSVSLEVISRFKQAILTAKSISNDNAEISSGNRGNKLYQPSSNALESLTSKIVEYDGANHLVMTNESIEKSNLNNKRRWHDFYGQSINNIDNDVEVDDNNDEDEDDYDENNNNNDNNENNEEYEVTAADDEIDDDLDDHPLKKIKLAEILAPLNHPSEVVSHPSISKTYKSPIFNKLASELIELIEVEQTNLNWLNKLLQVLNGEDWFYLLEENLGLEDYDHGLNDERVPSTSAVNTISTIESNERGESKSKEDEPSSSTAVITVATEEPTEAAETPVKAEKEPQSADDVDPFFALPQTLRKYEQYQLSMNNEDQQNENGNDQESNLKQDLINYLQVSIQRQQEYIKNLSQLRNGIVRADRLKKDIYKWGKEMHDRRSS